ncbi:MAG: metal-dependent hydrolase [bacterium]|nr:metal-dependent hydrolase [bacterium]
MFIHLLAGSLVFLLFGKFFDFEVGRMYLLLGAFWGIVPDPISYILSWAVKFNKWSHTHRDNFSHSIFFPGIVLVIAVLLDYKMVIAVGVAMLTHPFLDLIGIGWGVKLFYPLSKKTYKMFYRGRVLTAWNQDEVDVEADKFGDDDWVRNIYFRLNVIGASEWLSLAGFLLLVAMY